MRRLVEFPLEHGGSVVVEVPEDLSEGTVTRGWRDGDRGVLDQAGQTLEKSLGRVRPAVQALLEQLRSLADAPEDVQVEFGLQLSADLGAFVASASATSNFKVTMTWRNHAPASKPAPVGGRGGEARPDVHDA